MVKLINNYYVDSNNNRWSRFKYTEEEATRHSLHLRTSYNCLDCTYCTDCIDCISCKDCISCIDCNNCIGCVNYHGRIECISCLDSYLSR